MILADEAPQGLAIALLLDISRDAPVDEVVRLLRTHRGECRVYLNVETSDGLIGQIECNPAIRVSCTPEFLQAMVELLGRDAVCVLGPNRRAIPLQEIRAPSHAAIR